MIEMVIDQRRRDLGGGIEVGRVLPSAKRPIIGPFVLFDHMGPIDLARDLDRSADIRPTRTSACQPSPTFSLAR
jgi:redox-sensitive bicupin YhaK (pirin superfamily)